MPTAQPGRGDAPRARGFCWHPSLLVHTLVVCLILALIVAPSVHAAPVTGNRFDEAQLTTSLCCERVSAKWTYLKVWSEWCRTVSDPAERAHGARKLVKSLLSAPRENTTTAAHTEATAERLMAQPCTETRRLQPDAVELFMRSGWCHDLPRTHSDIVYSPYTVFAEAHPNAEDELVDTIVALCARLWQWPLDSVVPRVHASLSSASSARDAQRLLCGQECEADQDMFDLTADDL